MSQKANLFRKTLNLAKDALPVEAWQELVGGSAVVGGTAAAAQLQQLQLDPSSPCQLQTTNMPPATVMPINLSGLNVLSPAALQGVQSIRQPAVLPSFPGQRLLPSAVLPSACYSSPQAQGDTLSRYQALLLPHGRILQLPNVFGDLIGEPLRPAQLAPTTPPQIVASDSVPALQKKRGNPTSVQLNKQIMAARDTAELLALVRARGYEFDFFNISSAVARVPKLAGVEGPGSSNHHLDPTAKALADDLARLMGEQIQEFDARGLANSAWAFGKLKYMPSSILPSLIAMEAVSKIDDFSPQNLSNLVWSFVYMHYRDDRLLAVVADKVRERVTQFKPQELANVAWAFASLEHNNPAMVAVVAQRVLQIVKLFKEQELSNLTWAFGKLHHYDQQLFKALLQETKDKLHAFLPQGISNVAWSLATVGHKDTDLLDRIVAQCLPQVSSFDVQALSNLVWAMASLGYKHDEFLQALLEEAMQRLERLSPQNLSNVVWSCATLNYRDPRMLAAWAKQTVDKLHGFEPQGLANTVWAFAKLNHMDGTLYTALAAAILNKLSGFTSQGLSNTVWAYATAQQHHPALMDAIATQALQQMDGFNAQNCSVTAWSFATLRHYVPMLFDALLERMSTEVGACEPQNLSNMLWAFARMGHGLGPHAQRFVQATLQLLPQMNQQELCNSMWSLASLDLLDEQSFHLFCHYLQQAKGVTCEGLHQAFHAQLMFHSNMQRKGYVPRQGTYLPELPEPFLSAARNLWLVSAKDVHVSRFQQEVALALQLTGLPVTMEWLTNDGLFSIDLALEVNGRPVAIEVDGHHHFSANPPFRPLSDIALRRQLLQDRGWQVVNISFQDWEAMGANIVERATGVLARIARELGTMDWRTVDPPSRACSSPSLQLDTASLVLPRPTLSASELVLPPLNFSLPSSTVATHSLWGSASSDTEDSSDTQLALGDDLDQLHMAEQICNMLGLDAPEPSTLLAA